MFQECGGAYLLVASGDIFACIQIYFTDGTPLRGARVIIPRARLGSHEQRARLCSQMIVRLSWRPAGVGHLGQRVAVRICRRYSPDELGLTTWVYALSSRPVQRSIMQVQRVAASTHCMF